MRKWGVFSLKKARKTLKFGSKTNLNAKEERERFRERKEKGFGLVLRYDGVIKTEGHRIRVLGSKPTLLSKVYDDEQAS